MDEHACQHRECTHMYTLFSKFMYTNFISLEYFFLIYIGIHLLVWRHRKKVRCVWVFSSSTLAGIYKPHFSFIVVYIVVIYFAVVFVALSLSSSSLQSSTASSLFLGRCRRLGIFLAKKETNQCL